jgi:HAD superfamily hydrolase (TIGR01490 family)
MSIAFYDLDKTLLPLNSGTLWVKRELRLGHLSWRQAMQATVWLTRYRFGFANGADMVASAVAALRGTAVEPLRERTRQMFVESLSGRYRPGAYQSLDDHRKRGHACVLLTSSSHYLSELVAEELKLDGMLCNQIGSDGGVHTGLVNGTICFGDGKRIHALAECERRGVRPSECYFYTDSYADLAALEVVGHPVAVNPDVRLSRLAAKRQWPAVDWGTPEEVDGRRKG